MRAHIKQAAPAVLAYGLPAGSPQGDAVRRAMAGCGLQVRQVEPWQADCLVGDLADGRAAARPGAGAGPEAPAARAVLFSALGERQLAEALAALRAAGSPAELKAVVTPTSRTWTLRALLAELRQEHALMHGGEKV